QLLEADVLVRKLQAVNQVALVRPAIDAEQADCCGDRRLCLTGHRLLKARESFQRPRRPDLAKCQRRVVLQRSIELRDGGNRVDSVGGLIVAERLDDSTSKEI